MRVLVCVHCTVLGGANRSMLGLMDINQAKGIEYYVLLPEKGPLCAELEKRNIKYYIFPYYNWVHYGKKNSKIKAFAKLVKNHMIANQIVKIIKAEHIDIIHTNDSLTMIGALIARKARVPHIWHIREFLDDDYNLYYNYSMKYVRKLYSEANVVIAISKVIENHAVKKLGLKNSLLIYNGLEHKDDMHQKSKEFVVAFSGGDSEKKGILDVLGAFEIILKKRKDISLVIGGKFLNENLLERIRKIDKNGCIQIIGESKTWGEWLSKAHIALVCSNMEAFGRVTVESMFAKAVVIATNTGANEELIDNGKDGYIYKIGNIVELAEKICNIKDHYGEQKTLIECAYKKADSQFNIERTAKNVLEVYWDVFKKGANL